MLFHSILLDKETMVLTVDATGHPTDVLEEFHKLCAIVFQSQGAWRMTLVHGVCLPEMKFESETEWKLRAERKEDHQARLSGISLTPVR